MMNTKAISNSPIGKHLTLIQSIVCIALMLIICVMSFLPLFTMEVNMTEETKSKIEDVLEQVSGLTGSKPEFEIPDTIDVSLPFLVTTVVNSVDDISALMKGFEKVNEDLDELEESKENLEDAAQKMETVTDAEEAQATADQAKKDAEELEGTVNQTKEDVTEMTDAISQDLVNLVAFGMAIVSGFRSSIVVGLCYLFLLFMLAWVPLIAIISTLIALIVFLCRLKNPQKSFHAVARSFAWVVGLFPMLLLVMLLVPAVHFTPWIYVMLVLCALGLLMGLAASRLKYYEGADYKYFNLLQIVSAVSVGAFVLFFVTVAKSGVVAGMLGGLGSYVKNAMGTLLLRSGSVNIVPLVLVLVFVVLLLLAFGFLTKLVTRLACMSKSKSDCYIVSAALCLPIAVIPFLMPLFDFEVGLTGSGLVLFVLACVGIVLMLAAEIVLLVLRKTMCGAVEKSRRREIVTGSYTYCEATEEALAEDAPAEVAPVEELPAEETPVEDAPVEEAPVEEAPVEEAPVEEAPVEEVPAEDAPAEKVPAGDEIQ